MENRDKHTLKICLKNAASSYLVAETQSGETVFFHGTDSQWNELQSLVPYLQRGAVFNLINFHRDETQVVNAEFFILEPDYLLDISSLVECFRPYGAHPLNYTLSRLHLIENTSAILLGNTANFFIDELVHEDPDHPLELATLFRKLFRNAPFEFTACEDLKDKSAEASFFAACGKHFEHIRHVVHRLFPSLQIDREKLVLEPSFICNALGLQGRLDLMLQDYTAFVELKSGKGVEDYQRGGAFLHSALNHYTQMILYLAVLEFNLNLSSDSVQSYLLYSKYPVLSKESHSRRQLQQAISLRNSIVALEFDLQYRNDSQYTEKMITQIQSSRLNTANLSGNFFDNYLRPSIDRVGTLLDSLSELEKTYFMRLYTFVSKELWFSKVGEREYEGIKRAANLWNSPFEEKLEAGEIIYDMVLVDNQANSEEHFVVLEIPAYDYDYLPNFRSGDSVVLYLRNSARDTVNNRQVFKGAIEKLENNRIRIRLRARQGNESVLPLEGFYALEHDYMDNTFTGMYRALTTFLSANQDRKDLLLSRRFPEFDGEIDSLNIPDEVERILARIGFMKDCFLLVGPPGTGKTSIVLKKIVGQELQNPDRNILLVSYTNRAVDEICKSLISLDSNLNFIRIGNELTCDPDFRNHLLDSRLKHFHRRKDVELLIKNCRVFVGTVASVWNKPDLFRLKQFDLLIVDEASQLLEPHLLGLLCVKTLQGEDAVKRFVLIGDHKQLPAVVLQSEEDSKVKEDLLQEAGLTNLSNSLFERLYRNYQKNQCDNAFDWLSKQGRMHPDIMAFPSRYFYDNKLVSAGLPHQEEMSGGRLSFFPVIPSKIGKSMKSNPEEADQVVSLAKKIVDDYRQNQIPFDSHSLGIITPYRNQIALIRKKLLETGIQSLENVIIDTVERFQGGQKDVIIYSFCINHLSQLNTLPCMMKENGHWIDRKLNVVLTRARKQLWIVGNPVLLSQNELYRRLIETINS